MRKAYVVGANTHVHLRKHGIPVTDTNNIVLLDEEGNPLGNRITIPIPVKLLEKKDKPQFAKVLALANKNKATSISSTVTTKTSFVHR
ncbi:unnamed protein product [Strongylus vulgaris]|uniref:Uncharacterized protein n=1 Tax=Strongylus vulgaris TaxID=40348 RepID=A0A3P7KW52_STRVU|nr:unnamed protein product [Strongylus vulgaris]